MKYLLLNTAGLCCDGVLTQYEVTVQDILNTHAHIRMQEQFPILLKQYFSSSFDRLVTRKIYKKISFNDA